MVYAELQARELVVQAGRQLLEAGLVARTWGNISARISETQFVITPSGLAYERLTPEQLVPVKIIDCSYTGSQKPSSEKGIHADAYRLRPEVDFIVHTHQNLASVVGIEGRDLAVADEAEQFRGFLGDRVPCAAYGMPSTKKLRQAVEAAVRASPQSTAVLMKRHGALCMGKDFDHTFAISSALEALSQQTIRSRWDGQPDALPAAEVVDFGRSSRKGNKFTLLCNGEHMVCDVDAPSADLPGPAAIHADIYRHNNITRIWPETSAEVVAVSGFGRTLRPFLDDLAQIAGWDIRCGEASPAGVANRLKGRNAVLLRDNGALCTGDSDEDVEAVCMLLRKECKAQLYAAQLTGCRPLGRMDAILQRLFYVFKYQRQNSGTY